MRVLLLLSHALCWTDNEFDLSVRPEIQWRREGGGLLGLDASEIRGRGGEWGKSLSVGVDRKWENLRLDKNK